MEVTTTRTILEEELNNLSPNEITAKESDKQYLADMVLEVHRHTLRQSMIRVVEAALEEAVKSEDEGKPIRFLSTTSAFDITTYGSGMKEAYRQINKNISKIIKSLKE